MRLDESVKSAVLAFGICGFLAGCGGKKPEGTSADTPAVVSDEDYHADNDIAMTLASLVDAIRVREPLDSADYNFEGVLTDGQGRPLYTNIQGTPGVWDVDVLGPSSVVIRNVDLGDLLPEDLESYVTSALGLTPQDMVFSHSCDSPDTEIVVYDFDGGFLRIETRMSQLANGLEGPLMRIVASRKAPDFDQLQ